MFRTKLHFYPKGHKQTQAHSQKEEISISVESGESPFSRAVGKVLKERRFGSVANSFSVSGEVASGVLIDPIPASVPDEVVLVGIIDVL